MKILICDVCKLNGKITETTHYQRVKGHPELRLDCCPECAKNLPKKIVDYTILVYKIHCGIDLTPERAKEMLKNR